MNVIAIGGVPASGKTTLMRTILAYLDERGMGLVTNVGKLLWMHEYPELNAVVLGRYDEAGTFAGTDKLSMAVQPVALTELRRAAAVRRNTLVLFEGDRLFNLSFLNKLAEFASVRAVALLVSDAVADERCRARGSEQSTTFRTGRVTKVANIRARFPVTSLPNDTEANIESTRAILLDMVEQALRAAAGGNK